MACPCDSMRYAYYRSVSVYVLHVTMTERQFRITHVSSLSVLHKTQLSDRVVYSNIPKARRYVMVLITNRAGAPSFSFERIILVAQC